jgi:hypothetical protein
MTDSVTIDQLPDRVIARAARILSVIEEIDMENAVNRLFDHPDALDLQSVWALAQSSELPFSLKETEK